MKPKDVRSLVIECFEVSYGWALPDERSIWGSGTLLKSPQIRIESGVDSGFDVFWSCCFTRRGRMSSSNCVQRARWSWCWAVVLGELTA